MSDCSDYPTAATAKTFKLDAETTNEVVTLEQDRTSAASDGKTKKTFWGIESDATLQRENIEQLAEAQRDNLESTFTAQFAYKRIGNISLYVGNSLPEVDKLNSYQYPDDSGEWYGPVQDQVFPITIPADPSSDNGWSLVNALTSDSLSVYTDVVYKASVGKSAVDNMIDSLNLNPLSRALGTIFKTGGTTWRYEDATGPVTSDNFRVFNVVNALDYIKEDASDPAPGIQEAINKHQTVFIPDGEYNFSIEVEIMDGGSRVFGESLEGVKINPAPGLNAFVIKPDVSDTPGVFIEIDHLEISNENTSGGIRVTDRSRKIYLHHLRMHGLDFGIKVNDAWTVYISDCHINDNNRNVTVYRTVTENISPTTVYLLRNSIMNFNQVHGNSISIGESGQPDFAPGEQCSTLVISDNVMDGTKNYISGTTNLRYDRNHAEGGYANTPHLTIDTNNSSFVISASDNYIWDYDFGITIEGANARNVEIEHNYFRDITYSAVSAQSYSGNLAKSLNFFSGVGSDYEFGIRFSTNEASPGVSSIEGNTVTFDGTKLSTATELPNSGRFKLGDIFVLKPVSSAQGKVYQFSPGGSTLTALGFTNIGGANFSADAVSVGNTVTPVDIFSVKTGDRLSIPGAGTGATTLECVISSINYVAGTFSTNPSIKTDVTGSSVSFTGASDSAWRQLHSASDNADLDVQGDGTHDKAANFNSNRTENIAASGTFTIPIDDRSGSMMFIRDNTNSSSNALVLAAKGIGSMSVNAIIDNSSSFEITGSSSGVVIENITVSAKDFSFTLMSLNNT